MIIISVRQGFWSSFWLEDVQVREVFGQADQMGARYSSSAFLQWCKGKRLLVLIHGYDVKPNSVVKTYHLIEENIHKYGPSNDYDKVVGLTWPGGWSFSYWFSIARAKSAGKGVAWLLSEMAKESGAVDVMTHSLGARVLLTAMNNMPMRWPLRNVFLTAPAVDDESLETDQEFVAAPKRCGAMYVLFSKRDGVLNVLFPLGQFDFALGKSGPQRPGEALALHQGLWLVNCDKVIDAHGDYKRTGEVYRFISGQLEHPSIERQITLLPTK
jgi:esterase/lipase superfamily enzyme